MESTQAKRKKSRFRRFSVAARSKTDSTPEESELLLQNHVSPETEEPPVYEEEKKKKSGAPTVSEVAFRDVPVYVICPHCSEKIVTKISLERGKQLKCVVACLCIMQ